ncbi:MULTISPECIES: septal ring lytic transglycosylase RlpA family protein [unclassified Bradyrhizobium]|uniref:septal ring lytic transglycosylase RlpA family protein n=1 Tax=unclassified Bradyrhizobium TaxID=2631580 RepID=UPI0033941F68
MIAAVSTWTGLHATPAVGQTFNDRWSIVPKAHAEPAPEGLDQTKKEEPQAQSPNGQEPKDRSGAQSFNRFISGKASYYSYSKGKTASGSSFDRNLLTAAHRRLPFGTRVRVTDLETNKSVVVRITDRGPWVRGRVLDLSLAAARSLGITNRGVAQVRAEVL